MSDELYADILSGVICAFGGGAFEALLLRKRAQGSSLLVFRVVLAQIVFWIVCSLVGAGFTAITGWAWSRVASNIVYSAMLAVVFGIAAIGLCAENAGGWLSDRAKRTFCSAKRTCSAALSLGLVCLMVGPTLPLLLADEAAVKRPDPNIQELLSWLPEDTETLGVAQKFLTLGEAKPKNAFYQSLDGERMDGNVGSIFFFCARQDRSNLSPDAKSEPPSWEREK